MNWATIYRVLAICMGVEPIFSERQSDVITNILTDHMELDGRAARPIEGYKSPVLLVKLIQHMMAFTSALPVGL